jgi:hypothetical protein
MPESNGYNPIRYVCGRDGGCFLETRKPKIELLAHLLPGKCAFTDVDMFTERRGRSLVCEWKAAGNGQRPSVSTIERAQYRALQGLAMNPLVTVFAAVGDHQQMRANWITAILPFRPAPEWLRCAPSQYDALVRRWGIWASAQPMPTPADVERMCVLDPFPLHLSREKQAPLQLWIEDRR